MDALPAASALPALLPSAGAPVTEERMTPSLSLVSIRSPGFTEEADVTTFPAFLVML